jgi:hypothetical protein
VVFWRDKELSADVVVRPDGKIVTVYYFNDDVHNERFIEAVIWDPGSGTDG